MTIWEKQFQGIEQYAFYRSHPANPQRVKANRYASNKIKKHYIKGKVNPNVDKILKCNELFCNTSIANLSKDHMQEVLDSYETGIQIQMVQLQH